MAQNTYGRKFLKQAGRKGMMKWGAGKPVVRKEKSRLNKELKAPVR